MHYTPAHCNLSMVVSFYIGVEKATCFKWLQNVSFEEPWKKWTLSLNGLAESHPSQEVNCIDCTPAPVATLAGFDPSPSIA